MEMMLASPPASPCSCSPLPPRIPHCFAPEIRSHRHQISPVSPRHSIVSRVFLKRGHGILNKERHIFFSSITEDSCNLDSTGVDALSTARSFPLEEDLLHELASLKLQLKEKKRELKAWKKTLKTEKKLNKVQKVKNEKCKQDSSCLQEESSDSECECNSVDVITTGSGRSEEGEASSAIYVPAFQVEERCDIASTVCLTESGPTEMVGKGLQGDRIEVCMGGKCKKAGSQGLLANLQDAIHSGYGVSAVGCKCMGRCGMPINVRILKEQRRQQFQSRVRTEDDARWLLKHHFGVEIGATPPGLPSFGEIELNFQPA